MTKTDHSASIKRARRVVVRAQLLLLGVLGVGSLGILLALIQLYAERSATLLEALVFYGPLLFAAWCLFRLLQKSSEITKSMDFLKAHASRQ
jgi:hypothetical protein